MAERKNNKAPNKKTAGSKRTVSSAGKKKSAQAQKRTSSAPARSKKTAQEQKPMSKYRRRKIIRKRIMNSIWISVVIITAVILALVFLFRIGEIRVSGSTRYSKEEIISASELKLGENILSADTKSATERIPKVLPFIETAKVRKKSPTIVTIEVKEAVPAAVYQTESGYVLLSSTGKILKTGADDYINEVPIIKGVSFKSAEVGAQAVYADGSDFGEKEIQSILDELFVGIAKYDLNIRIIDWTKPITIKLNYNEILIIDLGYPERIDEKLLAAKCFIDESLIEGEKGVLRVSDPDNMAFTFDPYNEALIVSAEQPQEGE